MSDCTPAHKQTDWNKRPGQIVNDMLLSDYIERKQQAATPKMNFEQWFKQYNAQHGLPPAYVVARAAWEAAQENV